MLNRRSLFFANETSPVKHPVLNLHDEEKRLLWR
jgi:hypothetical protein